MFRELERMLEVRSITGDELQSFVMSRAQPLLSRRKLDRLLRRLLERSFAPESGRLLPHPDHVYAAELRGAAAQCLGAVLKKGWGDAEREKALFQDWTQALASQPREPLTEAGWGEWVADRDGLARVTSARKAYLAPAHRAIAVLSHHPDWVTPGALSVAREALAERRAAREQLRGPWQDDVRTRLENDVRRAEELVPGLTAAADHAARLIDGTAAAALAEELRLWKDLGPQFGKLGPDLAKLAYRFGVLAEERSAIELAPSAPTQLVERAERAGLWERRSKRAVVSAWLTAGAVGAAMVAAPGLWVAAPAATAIVAGTTWLRRIALERHQRALAQLEDSRRSAAGEDPEYLETLAELDREFPAEKVLK